MVTPLFDLGQLFVSIDAERERQGLSWAALSRLVGVSASTIRRFGDADDAEADGVLVLIGWLGVAPEHFVSSAVVSGAALPPAGDGVIRVDMTAVAEATAPRQAGSGTRTTIQRLVAAAHSSERTVESLTRWSPV